MKSCQLSVVSCQRTFSRRRHGGDPFSRRVHAARDAGFGTRDSGLGVRQIPNPKSQIPNLKSPVLSPLPSPLSPRSAFTLVEMLVVVTIIGILSAMAFGALQMARETAREMATKATIAKLNNVIMRRYESYRTRRVPIRIPTVATPRQAAEIRLAAIRDLMRMEMPERWNDVSDAPGILPHLVVPLSQPALHLLYQAKYTSTPNENYSHAKCLFMIISMGSPEAMEQFHQSEIATDTDGWQYFVDGWGRPIYFLRWAPGWSPYSDIQFSDATNHHDPFDTRRVDDGGYALFPLIFSFGKDTNSAAFVGGGIFGNLNMGEDVHFPDSNNGYLLPDTICGSGPYVTIGEPDPTYGAGATGNITNHHIEQR